MSIVRKVYTMTVFIGCVMVFLSCDQKKEWHTGVQFTLQQEQLSGYEANIDHAGIIGQLDEASFQKGAKTYQTVCHNCHGNIDDEGSLPTALRFWDQKFKVGNDPFSMYQTIARGFNAMPPQVQLTPVQKYEVIHYIREQFIKTNNPQEYSIVDGEYLSSLPTGTSLGPKPKIIQPWVDMDYGDFLINTYELVDEGTPKRVMSSGRKAPLKDEDFTGANFAYKGIAIRLDKGEGGVAKGSFWTVFDHDLLRVAGGWSGEGFIDWNGILLNGKHNIYPRNIGQLQFSNATAPGWANPKTGSFEDVRFLARDGRRFGPLPQEWGRYNGIYHHEDHIIVSYSIGNSEMLEEFGIELLNNNPVYTRILNINNIEQPLKMRVAPIDAAVQLVGTYGKLQKEDGYHVLVLSEGKDVALKLLVSKSSTGLKELSQTSSLPESLNKYTLGGRPHYSEELTTEITQLNAEGAFTVDVLTPPYYNKWQSRLRLSGIDFFEDDDKAVVCCTEGDVWIIKGLKNGNGKLKWKRIASGLFQPLGIKVINGEIYVTCRDQIVVLRDLNGDEETDFYECFNSDHQVTDHFHEFAMGLQIDTEGNLYYAKSGRHAREALVPQHGTLLKVSKDGSRTEIIANGFRAANGVCINPGGSFLVTDQEGHWNPMNRINWVNQSGFYGNMFGYNPPADSSDEAMLPPMSWVDKQLDRSPSELLWVDSDKWRPFNGSLLSLSYGFGKVFLVPHEKVNGQMQGSLFELPIPNFQTGVMRGRFHPTDGQLYACGMSAWGTKQRAQLGALYRVKYTGEPVIAPVKVHAIKSGLKLVFATQLDKSTAEDVSNYQISTWSLKRTSNYGSDHYDEKQVKVLRADLANDSITLNLNLSDMKPVWQMEILFTLKDIKGNKTEGKIHSTIHNLGD